MSIKILHVLDHSVPYMNGYSFRSKYIIGFQKNAGKQPFVVTSPKHISQRAQEEIDGITYYRTRIPENVWNGAKKRIPFLRERLLMKCLYARILQVAKEQAIDVIHAHSPVLCGWPALQAAKRLNIPLVYEIRALWEDAAVDQGKTNERSIRYKLTRYIETRLARQADIVVTICEGLKRELIERGIEKEKIHVMPNGVDADKFTPHEKNKDLLDKYKFGGYTVVGFIGSFYHYEGLACLLRAVPGISSQNKQVKFLIVGGGEEETDLKALAEDLNIGGILTFAGKVPHDDILKYYSVMDILVYPRMKKRITELVTPLKPLEAMAMEKIVLGSDVNGIKELVEDNKTGLLFKAEDIDDLANKCSYLISNMSTARELGKGARADMIENRSWKKIVAGYLGIYEKLIEGRYSENN